MEICYLGVGANLGNRRLSIKQAVNRINLLENTRVLKKSAFIQTAPVGGPAGQPKFLNAALKIQTDLSPLKLLKALKAIEKELGRKESVRNAPRTIDLDILLYGDKVIRGKKLIIPHSRMFVRDFVIGPLSEII
ncbi:MAG: 2-amino-4-hydroxy-6-hydroxymethyldihydropteridine diphosphokinase [Candidatus Omnitrophica bacterium]|nr:2-amino-4-hydroxy-6-hydroxymethyldihydropteridine diphosphokinase [Candidatus Omnitrophota bacterium]MDD5027069.1 2-amino-4-hydroxy-6-hydroxymethyldihydropteridine diphosphokinase [Candidatus Omnitrophota bacterium]MDD5662092.1 2-amino-4-hydroxy-6-hydroxymethyldihydropteridine diphosphokinase [Candidatus Omnitrophota bacterium]